MDETNRLAVDYFGGPAGALLLTSVFISGVITLSLMGAPDEREFWPILIMGLVVCTFPFILPYFTPVILMSGTTLSGADFNIAAISPLEVGLHNFLSWSLMIVTLFAVVSGYGRDSLPTNVLKSADVS